MTKSCDYCSKSYAPRYLPKHISNCAAKKEHDIRKECEKKMKENEEMLRLEYKEKMKENEEMLKIEYREAAREHQEILKEKYEEKIDQAIKQSRDYYVNIMFEIKHQYDKSIDEHRKVIERKSKVIEELYEIMVQCGILTKVENDENDKTETTETNETETDETEIDS